MRFSRRSSSSGSGLVSLVSGIGASRRKENVGLDDGVDELHQDIRMPPGHGDGLQKGRDGGAVDVVAAAFERRLEDVLGGCRGVACEFAASSAGVGDVV